MTPAKRHRTRPASRRCGPAGSSPSWPGIPHPGSVPDLGLAVACARAAGLVYAQHIILIHAAIDGGRLRPLPGLRPAAPSPREGPQNTRIHTDLLIFTNPGARND